MIVRVNVCCVEVPNSGKDDYTVITLKVSMKLSQTAFVAPNEII